MTAQALEDVAATALDAIVDTPRDRWGRPMIIPPNGGAPVAYTRCTTYVDCLDDTFNLTQWKRRSVATGLAQRPDLLLRVSSLGPQPPKFEPAPPGEKYIRPDGKPSAEYKRWKAAMDEVCDAATEAAKATAAATVGTALHALTERLDRGQDVGVVPAQYEPHLKAYAEATSAFTAVHIERFSVLDDLRIGGTPDRVLAIDGHPKLVIGDLKTGDTEFGIGKIAMQLAVYAHSLLYNPETGQRTSLGDVDLERGVVIALSADTGRCELKWVNLVAGWEDVQLASRVREARARAKRKGELSRPYDGPATVTQENARDLTAEARAALAVAIPRAQSEEELDRLWRAAGNQWTAADTEAAKARMAELAALKPHLTPVG